MKAMLRAAAVIGALTAVLVGCGSPARSVESPSSAPPPPNWYVSPRPVAIAVDDVDPCTLIRKDQYQKYDILGGSYIPVHETGWVHGPLCFWVSTYNHQGSDSYTSRVVTDHGIEYALNDQEPYRIIEGYAAQPLVSPGSDPSHWCGMMVDIAPGRALSASYDDGLEASQKLGIGRKQVCDKAAEMAKDMILNLRAQRHQ